MRISPIILAGLLAGSSFGVASAKPSATEGSSQPDIGYITNSLDRSVKPGQNFFEYANGGWRKAHPIPADHSRWGTFNVLHKRNQQRIRKILESAAQNKKAKPGSNEQKIGDFYASGMDQKAINATGLKPLKPELKRIGAISDVKDLQREIAHLQARGVNALFEFSDMQDFKKSTQVIGAAFQGGLGLPDRSYYFKTDKQSQKIREQYVRHIGKMLQLLGEKQKQAKTDAKQIMTLETELAKASMTRIKERNPHNIYHPMPLAKLDKLTPNFAWQKYFALVGVPNIKHINVGMPEFFKTMNAKLKAVPMEQWKTYLRWHLINATAPYLSQPFVAEDFKFNSVISGAQKNLPRWQRVASAEDDAIGFAVGKRFVKKYFSAQSKQRVLHILHDIKGALKSDIETLSWMGPKTRKQALKKLSLIVEKIGYPDQWRDYSKLKIKRDSYVRNVLRANQFEFHRELNKIGKPVNRHEWGLTPQTVNAYYNPSKNEIVFPAGILQPPFFSPDAPAAVNYGAVGVVMGHETSHGFDDQGSQFDGHGNLKNWWTKADLKKFKANTKCVAQHFSSYTVDGNVHVQGKLVTGEAIADLGGTKLAYRAFQSSQAGKAEDGRKIDGFTPNQLFFLGFAHVWASNIRPQEARHRIAVDPHPPAKYRVNGTLANVPEFQKAFNIPANSPMVNKHRCVIW